MSDNERLRTFAQVFIDEANEIVDRCGVVGGHIEVARAETAHKLIALLDGLPPLAAYERIPPAIRDGLLRYKQGVRPGSFLASVLANDLAGAMARGADDALLALPAIMAWIKAELPGEAWGGYAHVDAHVDEWCRRARS